MVFEKVRKKLVSKIITEGDIINSEQYKQLEEEREQAYNIIEMQNEKLNNSEQQTNNAIEQRDNEIKEKRTIAKQRDEYHNTIKRYTQIHVMLRTMAARHLDINPAYSENPEEINPIEESIALVRDAGRLEKLLQDKNTLIGLNKKHMRELKSELEKLEEKIQAEYVPLEVLTYAMGQIEDPVLTMTDDFELMIASKGAQIYVGESIKDQYLKELFVNEHKYKDYIMNVSQLEEDSTHFSKIKFKGTLGETPTITIPIYHENKRYGYHLLLNQQDDSTIEPKKQGLRSMVKNFIKGIFPSKSLDLKTNTQES